MAGCFYHLGCFGSCNLVGGCSCSCCSEDCNGHCWHCWHSLLLDCEGHDIWHLNTHGADGRSKRTLHCTICLHCIGFGFIGGIDSDFWLVAAATCYCLDGRFWLPLCFLLFELSIVLNKVIDVFGCGV